LDDGVCYLGRLSIDEFVQAAVAAHINRSLELTYLYKRRTRRPTEGVPDTRRLSIYIQTYVDSV